MGKNTNLHKAKRVRNDEFYTRYEDIEIEVSRYKDLLKDKKIYCPCDGSNSAFWQFFVEKFAEWGLREVVATNSKNTELLRYNGELQRSNLDAQGDFRSSACIELLDECDIVITNPPFSLIREFIPLLLEHKKQFLVIGPLNALTYKEIFPYVIDKKIWSGYNNVRHFCNPDGTIRTMGNVFWYTNLPNQALEKELELSKNYVPTAYARFDARKDIINIDKVTDIPKDYDDLMAVPTSFFQGKYNPNQFEICGECKHGTDGDFDFCKPIIDGVEKYTRLVIRRVKK